MTDRILFDDDWNIDADMADNSADSLSSAIKSGRWLDTREVKLGATIDNVLRVAVADDNAQFANEIWFTELDDSSSSTAINTIAQFRPDQHVELGRPPKDPLNWYVRELSFTPQQNTTAFSGTTPHARAHTLYGVGSAGSASNIVKGFAGEDPVLIDDRGLFALGIIPNTGMTVAIGNGSFIIGGVRVDFSGWTSPDWTADIPSTGLAFWRLLEVDGDGDIVITDGSEFSPLGVDVLAQIPDGSPSEYYQCGAVFLEGGMSAIYWNYIYSNPGLRSVDVMRIISISSSTNTSGPGIYEVDTTGGAITLTLDTDDVVAGRQIIVKDVGGVTLTNHITVDTEGAETINDGSELVFLAPYGSATLYSDGTNWYTLNYASGTGADLAADTIKFDGTADDDEGLLWWNDDDGTLNVSAGAVTYQLGQEIAPQVRNGEAYTLDNGVLTMHTGTIGASGRIVVEPFVSDGTYPSFAVAGPTTESISSSEDGKITHYGVVRNIDTSAWAAEDLLYSDPTSPGDFTNVQPEAPNIKQPYAKVIRSDAVNGSIFVRIEGGACLSENVNDVEIDTPTDGQVLAYDNGNSRWENKTASISIDESFTIYIERNQRNLDENIHGGLFSLSTGDALDNTPTNINVTVGIGKLILVINAGTDFAGDITFTGTTVDRNTGVETPADTDTITIDALTTDNSDTDAQGNTRHSFTGAYITSKWFTGAVVISTADVTLTDVDTYQCSFEQFNDQPDITLKTFDCSTYATNSSAWFYAYLYALEVTSPKLDLSRISSLELPVATTAANKSYRRRHGNIAKALDGSTDGIFIDLFFGPAASVYFQDTTMKVWYSVEKSLTLT